MSEQVQSAIVDLERFVAIPSVSSENRALGEAAEFVRRLLSEEGFETELHDGEVGPFVVGTIGTGPTTIVVYNHYDVQPAGDRALWATPPFEVVQRDGRLYGRGVADDKGEFMSRLAGWRQFRSKNTSHPSYRLVWIVDGEEEIGSPSLDSFLATRFAGESADVVWWEFGEIDASGRPVIHCGYKGNAVIELRSRTAASDMHSSLGAVYDNALWRICAAVASMRDASGRVTIKGFDDDILPLTLSQIRACENAPYSLASLSHSVGAETKLAGVDDRSFYSAINYSPCLNVNGIGGGFQGDGPKTVLPAQAFVKLDFRLVPSQTPQRTVDLVRRHLDDIGMSDIEILVHDAVVEPVRSSADHWFVAESVKILRGAFDQEPIVQPSSPASGTAHPFVKRMGAAIFGIGLTHHGAQLHAPNENILVDHFGRMIDASSAIFAALEKRASKSCAPMTDLSPP